MLSFFRSERFRGLTVGWVGTRIASSLAFPTTGDIVRADVEPIAWFALSAALKRLPRYDLSCPHLQDSGVTVPGMGPPCSLRVLLLGYLPGVELPLLR